MCPSDKARLLALRASRGRRATWSSIRTVTAASGHRSRKLAWTLRQCAGWRLVVIRQGQRAFKIGGITWIMERSFAWFGRDRRFSTDYEFKVRTSETLIEVAATRLVLNRITPA
ncbi:MAG: hypothetical protein EOO77_40920 [Oxalobacteraceae bacterium]|nr:MAG: hypothetical protein EOO77_40920 [Oxalobacteraceae bacterium]